MENHNYISTNDFCTHYNVDYTFICKLHDQGLLHLHAENNNNYLDIEELNSIEKLIRLHYEMDINVEGIDAIFNLLQKVSSMQTEITSLKNKLRLYENA